VGGAGEGCVSRGAGGGGWGADGLRAVCVCVPTALEYQRGVGGGSATACGPSEDLGVRKVRLRVSSNTTPRRPSTPAVPSVSPYLCKLPHIVAPFQKPVQPPEQCRVLDAPRVFGALHTGPGLVLKVGALEDTAHLDVGAGAGPRGKWGLEPHSARNACMGVRVCAWAGFVHVCMSGGWGWV
jgi:hypothetical protein